MAEEGLRISDLYNQRNNGRTHGGIILAGSDLTETNVSQRTKGWTLDELTEYIKSGIPAPPEGVKWVTPPTVEIEESTFIRAVFEAQANWDGVIVNYLTGTIQQVTLPGAGLERFDAVYANEDGTYGVVTGDASQSPVTPQIPNNALFVTYVKWTSAGGSLSTLPTFTNTHTSELYKHPVSYLRYPTLVGLGFPELEVDNFYGYAVATSTPGAAEGRLTLYRSTGEVWNQGRAWNNGIVYSEWFKQAFTFQEFEVSPNRGSIGTFITITGVGLSLVTGAESADTREFIDVVSVTDTEVILQLTDPISAPAKQKIVMYTSDGKEIFTTDFFTYVEISFTGIDVTTVSPGTRIHFSGANAYTVAFIVFPGNILAPFRQYRSNNVVGYVDVPIDVFNGTGALGYVTTAGTYATTALTVTIENASTGGDGSITVDDALSDTSTNPVQNKVVKAAFDSLGTTTAPENTSGGTWDTPITLYTAYVSATATWQVGLDTEARATWPSGQKIYANGVKEAAVTLPATRRIDTWYASEDGTVGKVTGDESTNPVAKLNPAGTLWMGEIHWNASGGSVNATDHTHENATTSKAGFMSPAHVTALGNKVDKSTIKTTLNNVDTEVPTSKAVNAFVTSAVSEGTYGTSSLIQVGKFLTPLYLTQWGNFASQVHSTNLGVTMLFYPVDKAISIDAIQVQVNTADASNTTQFGIYRCGLDGRPKDILRDIGTATWSSTGVITITFPELIVNPPGFFIGHQSNAALAALRAVSGSNGISLLGVTGVHTNQVSVIGFLYTNTYGALPTDLTGVTESGTVAGTTATMGIAVRKSA